MFLILHSTGFITLDPHCKVNGQSKVIHIQGVWNGENAATTAPHEQISVHNIFTSMDVPILMTLVLCGHGLFFPLLYVQRCMGIC